MKTNAVILRQIAFEKNDGVNERFVEHQGSMAINALISEVYDG